MMSELRAFVKEYGTEKIHHSFIRKYIYFDRFNQNINYDNWIWVLSEEYRFYAIFACGNIVPKFMGHTVTSALIEQFCYELSQETIRLIKEKNG